MGFDDRSATEESGEGASQVERSAPTLFVSWSREHHPPRSSSPQPPHRTAYTRAFMCTPPLYTFHSIDAGRTYVMTLSPPFSHPSTPTPSPFISSAPPRAPNTVCAILTSTTRNSAGEWELGTHLWPSDRKSVV